MVKYKLLIKSPDEQGLVYKISKILYESNLNIDKQSEFVDKDTNTFYLRTQFSGECDKQIIEDNIKKQIPNLHLIKISPFTKKNIIIFVTKESHVIGDLLIKHKSDELNANILAVIGNHNTLSDLINRFDIPFHHISHEGIDKKEYEIKILQLLATFKDLDLIILAKYMRILSPEFVDKYKHKIINIHHSFLPAFIGKEPYKQAFDRGVKIIGASAHYVTKDLDEGAIIDQDIIKIDHSYDVATMKEYGKNIETLVLSNALKLALSDRIFIDGNKTVIL